MPLPELVSAATPDGGLRVTFAGQRDDLLVQGGLEDTLTGYSAEVILAPAVSDSSTPSVNQYASLGLMTGTADPMLKFPAGTIFTPYANVRNISGQNVTITPVLWWMQGAAPQSARLPQFTILPFHSAHLDLPTLLSAAGLQHFAGNINLILETAGSTHSLLIATGSVDQKNTYVFSVPSGAIRESVGKSLSYWNTANGNDTMVTLWNPADDPQDFLFTLFFSGGQYELPVHLEGRVSRSFNISEIIENQIPDSQGRTIPATVQEGSAEVTGSQGEAQHILLAMAAGTYNVVKATCVTHCITCEGAVRGTVNSATVGTGQSQQLSFTIYNYDGTQYDDTPYAQWSSSNTNVATVDSSTNPGLVQGVSVGSVTITANDPNVNRYASNVCLNGDYPDCGSVPGGMTSSATITVAIPCFAQLKYRSVDLGPVPTGKNHSFWWIQDSNYTQWVIDAGPTGSCAPDCGYLDDWYVEGSIGHYSEDNSNDSTAWDSGLSPQVCGGVSNLFAFAVNWQQDTTPYTLGGAPNSNTFAHQAGNAAPFSPTAPPNAPGW